VRIIHDIIGVPLKYFPDLAALEFAGALGLVLPWCAGIGLMLYFVGAVVSHLRIGDVKGVGPAAFMLTFAVVTLVVRILIRNHGA
jgi:DoxX-like protein